MNRRFASQINARIALDQLRREIHCASAVTPTGTSASITIMLGIRCPSAGAGTTVSWCTSGTGTRYALYRLSRRRPATTAGKKPADYLTTGTVFSFAAQSTSSLADPLGDAARQHEAGERAARLQSEGRHRPAQLDPHVTPAPPDGCMADRADRSFTATGSATQGAAVPDSLLSLFRRLLGDERGLALPYALGVTMILSSLAAGDLHVHDHEPGCGQAPAGRSASVRARRDGPELRAVDAAERGRPDLQRADGLVPRTV